MYTYLYIIIVCIGVSIPPQKYHPFFLAKTPPLPSPQICKLSKAPCLGNPPLYCFSVTPRPLPPPLAKVGFFSELPKYYNFSSLTSPYL